MINIGNFNAIGRVSNSGAVSFNAPIARTNNEALALAIIYGGSSYLNYTDSNGIRQTASYSLKKFRNGFSGSYQDLFKQGLDREAADLGKAIREGMSSLNKRYSDLNLGTNLNDIPAIHDLPSNINFINDQLLGYAVIAAGNMEANGWAAHANATANNRDFDYKLGSTVDLKKAIEKLHATSFSKDEGSVSTAIVKLIKAANQFGAFIEK